MKPNVWLATFGVVSALLIGGAGFFCMKAKGGYDTAMSSWNNKLGQIKTLSRKVPFPDADAEKTLQAQLDDYKAAVQDLYDRLNEFQKPLNTELSDVEFQQLVRKKVDDLVAKAGENNFVIEDVDEFFLGFDQYKTKIPDPAMVPVLDYELGAIDHMVNLLVDKGADSLLQLTRDLIPGEEGALDAATDSAVAHMYPVRIKFRASHESFQSFMNTISNDKEYFYTVRVMRIENEDGEPPVKLAPAGGLDLLPKYVNPVTSEVATLDILEAEGYPNIPEEELVAKMKAKGFELAGEDARILMGVEKLDIYMIIDIVRFLNPDEVKAEEAAPAKRGAR